jgi:hypothetical protein
LNEKYSKTYEVSLSEEIKKSTRLEDELLVKRDEKC